MKRELIQQIPFIDEIPPELEFLFLQPYYDLQTNDFKMYIQDNDKLSFVYAEPVEACYWSEKIIDDKSDIYIGLLDIISRQYSYNVMSNILMGLKNDIINMSVYIEKYFLLNKNYLENKEIMISSILKTDLECFFGNTRSIFDLINNIIVVLYKKRYKKNMPDSFRKLVEKDQVQLRSKYGLQDPMINLLNKWKSFFIDIRVIRDAIYHGGLSIESVFCFKDGFAFSLNDNALPIKIFKSLNEWDTNKMKKNQMVSFLALISYINTQMLLFLGDFSKALLQSVPPHNSITKNMKLFLRGPYIHHLNNLNLYLENPWI